MNHYSKKIFQGIFMMLLMISVTSCVSTKKYNEMEAARIECEVRETEHLARIDNLEARATALEEDTAGMGDKYRLLQNEVERYVATSSAEKVELLNELKQKEAELNAKEQTLADREARMKELQEMISQQRRAASELLNRVQNALTGFNSEELSVENRNGRVYVSLSEKLLFQSGRTNVDPKGKEALEKLGDVLKKNPDIDILVEGHTDTVPIKTPKFEDNWDLSVQRATSITRILEGSGVDPKRITAAGHGQYYPVAPNTTAEGRAKNRRTEIILQPKLDQLYELIQRSGSAASDR
ncbi:MAG: OmpA family protein [Bacteroidia bacterium]